MLHIRLLGFAFQILKGAVKKQFIYNFCDHLLHEWFCWYSTFKVSL